MTALNRVLDALRAHGLEPRQHGKEWSCSCPAHDDRRASFGFTQPNGKVLLKCQAGCSSEEIVAALGLELRDLFDGTETVKSREVGAYRYTDEDGKPLFEVVRFEPKDFRQRRPDGTWGVKGVPMVLYNLPAVLAVARAGGTVYVVEGEKDADRLNRDADVADGSVVATCNPGGAGKWRDDYSKAICDAHVVVVADRDKAGRKHARQVAESVGRYTSELRVVEAAAGKDLSDHLDAGLGLADLRPIEAEAPTNPAPATREPTGSDLPADLTELGAAHEFARALRGSVLYVRPWASWLEWDGTRWHRDADGNALARAVALAEELAGRCAQAAKNAPDRAAAVSIIRFAHFIRSRRGVENALALCQSLDGMRAPADGFDAEPMLLNTPSGVVDLATGACRPHDPGLRLTRCTGAPYSARATAPTWQRFLSEILKPELVPWIQRVVGYALTGRMEEHAFFLLWGTGANGKTTFLETLRYVFGDYAMDSPFATFLQKSGDGVPNDLARLRGARLITASEPNPHRSFDDSVLKKWTGGEPMTARFMRAEFFEFQPEGKLFFACNAKPAVHDSSDGFWRRARIIPFTERIPEERQDKTLPGKLRAEAAGILAWAVDGAMLWAESGLGCPPPVRQATDDYRVESDSFGDFLAERCYLDPDAWSDAGPLFEAYRKWAEAGGFRRPLNATMFGRTLSERGFRVEHSRAGKIRHGLALRGDL